MKTILGRIAIIVVLLMSGLALADDEDLWDPEGKSDEGAKAKKAIAEKRLDLTGVWKCSDGGTYYIRQIGREVWWVGKSGVGGKRFTNVFHGQLSADASLISGRWADVPEGVAARAFGQLRVRISTPGKLNVASESGGFGGREWTR